MRDTHTPVIEYTPVTLDDNAGFTCEGEYMGVFQFLPLRSMWGDAPYAGYLEQHQAIGFRPRGAGNSDPYIYVLSKDDDVFSVALVDVNDIRRTLANNP